MQFIVKLANRFKVQFFYEMQWIATLRSMQCQMHATLILRFFSNEQRQLSSNYIVVQQEFR